MMRAGIKDKIKPLWILISDRWGGPEQVAMSDMVDMANVEIGISLLCLEGSPVHAAALRHPRIKVHSFNHRPRKRFDWSFVRALRGIIESVGANIVHINDEKLLWYLAPALLQRPDISIISSRHTVAEASIKDFVRAFFLRRLDYMIVLSESIREGVMSKRVISEKKVKVINLGLDFTRFDPSKASGKAIRATWGADKDTIVIGSVGRLVPEVGQDTFLKAAAGLLKHHEWKMRFVIVGEEPLVASEAYVASLKDLVTQFHMDDIVTFSSLGDNLPDVMSAFDIFVMPGREEVPGLGALEALAMERPVVLSNVIGAEDIVGRKEFGLLVRPEDAFDLQTKILNLLENPSQRLAMGSNGRTHVLRHFDRRTRFEKSIDLYERCIRRRYARLARIQHARTP
ncbi:MAG: glycosyltransferase family 4 protein [Deltaproteobacteria bacterium]|nr:glycosyltransferase family 4 protein [Deltaproteobacteria bacterium]